VRKERIALIRGLLGDSGTDNSGSDDSEQESQPVSTDWVDLMIMLTGE
jgi:hypothetical protein